FVTIENLWDQTTTVAKRVIPIMSSEPYISDIKLPVGSKIISTDVGDGKLFIRVEKPDGKQSIFVIDTLTGIKTGTLDLF
ncbi:MAG: hypothetical protein ACO3MJ_09045, partial [Alphaproteobacteria bacterium]